MHAVLPKGLSSLSMLALVCCCGHVGAVELAEPGVRAPINGRFKLKVGAFLRRSIEQNEHDTGVQFQGHGRAVARHRSVILHFDVLNAKGERGHAVIKFDHPLRRNLRFGGKFFKGPGKVEVKIRDISTTFIVVIGGKIERSATGAVMHGHFQSVHPTDLVSDSKAPVKFGGRFRGMWVKPHQFPLPVDVVRIN